MDLPDIHSHAALFDSDNPEGVVPCDVQEVNGDLYVTYASQNAACHDEVAFPGFDFVDKFSPLGKLLQRLRTIVKCVLGCRTGAV